MVRRSRFQCKDPTGVKIDHLSAKAVDEESGCPLDNEMIGFEPGDEAFAAICVIHRPKSKKRMHLMDIAKDRLAQHFERMHQRIALHLQKRAFATAYPPNECIKKGVPVSIAVAEDQIDEVRYRPRQSDGWRRRGDIFIEQFWRIVARPQNFRRRDIARNQTSRSAAKSVSIGAPA
jgi:hypothetical protein